MGVTWVASLKAWNFALYSRRATGVTLLLYAADDYSFTEERSDAFVTDSEQRGVHGYPNTNPLKLKGARFFIDARDPSSVQITKNGLPLSSPDANTPVQ